MRYKVNFMLRLNWCHMAMRCGRENRRWFIPEDEKPPPANAGDKETKPVPVCAGNIGTGNDSGCPLAKPPLVMFDFMVCKRTAGGGGKTSALECILLTGNETDGAEACNGRMTMDFGVTQTGDKYMSEVSGSHRF